MPDFSIETNLEYPVIGLDEVGRGPLAGPVVSCGCYFKNYKKSMYNEKRCRSYLEMIFEGLIDE